MKLTGLHFLLTWQCIYECEHCFVFGGPRQTATWRMADLRKVLDDAKALGTVDSIYYEGGEPFLVYPILVQAAKEASERGFRVGVVSNGYWASTQEDALTWLSPFGELLDDLSVSSDLYHSEDMLNRQEQLSRLADNASQAAQQLGIPTGLLQIEQPDSGTGQRPSTLGTLMYRGRAAVKLAGRAPHHPWAEFIACPYEDLADPGRVHVDPYGNLHVCQGILIGNCLQTPLAELVAAYDPQAHPIIGPLLRGGPAEVARAYGVTVAPAYADACHLCFTARRALLARFPDFLGPYGMYQD